MVIQVFWPAIGDTVLHSTPYSFHQHAYTGFLAGHRWYCSSPYTMQLPSTWWHRLSGRPQVILQFTLHHTASINMVTQVFWPATGETAVHPTQYSFHQHGDTGCLAGHRRYFTSPYTIQLPSTWWYRLSGRPQVILQFTLHYTASINMVTQVVWPEKGDTAVDPTPYSFWSIWWHRLSGRLQVILQFTLHHTASINMVTQVVWPPTGDTAVHSSPYSFHQHGDTGCLAGHRWYCSSSYTIQLPSIWWHRLSGQPQVILQFTLHPTASIYMVTQVVWPARGYTALHPTPYSFHQHGSTGFLAGQRWYCSSPYTIQLPSTWWYRFSGRPQVILEFKLLYTASINMVTQVVWPATGDTALYPTPYSFHQHGDTGCLAGHRWYCSSPYTIQLPSTWWHRLSGPPQVKLQFTLHHTASINMVIQVVWPATGDTAIHPTPYSFHQHYTGDTGCLAGNRWYCTSPYTIQLPSTWWYRLSGRPQVILHFTLHYTASINMVTQVVWPAKGDTAVHLTPYSFWSTWWHRLSGPPQVLLQFTLHHTASINMVTQHVWPATGDSAVHPTPYSFHQYGDTCCHAGHRWYCTSPYTIQLPSTWWHRLSGRPQVILQFILHYTTSINMVTQVVWPATGETAVHPTPYSFHQHGNTGFLAGHRWYCSSFFTIQLPSTWWHRFLAGHRWYCTSSYTIQLPSTWWYRFFGRPQVILQFTLHHIASINMVTQVFWPVTGDTAVHPTPYSFHQHGDTVFLAGHRWYCSSPYTIQLPSTWWHRLSGPPQVILQFNLHHTASINMVTQVVCPATGDTAVHPTPYSFHQHGDTGCLARHRWYCSSHYTIQLPSKWWYRLSGRPQVILQFILHHTASINMVTQVVKPATGDTAVHATQYSFHQHGDTGFLAGHR